MPKVKLPVIIISLTVAITVSLYFYYDNLNSTDNSDRYSYLLQVPNLNFEILFPSKPNFLRQDERNFTRYNWSYIDNDNALFLQVENDLYSHHRNHDEFIQEMARVYNGIVTKIEHNQDDQSTYYEIQGLFSDVGYTSHDVKIGRVLDHGGWTFHITNRYKEVNKYPEFIYGLKIVKL